MAFLSISYDLNTPFPEFTQQLGKVGKLSVDGDWHEQRLAIVELAGLPADSAPARSIAEDKLRIGKSFAATLLLENGAKLKGQIRPDGLLLGNINESVRVTLEDSCVQNLLLVVGQLSKNVNIEVG